MGFMNKIFGNRKEPESIQSSEKYIIGNDQSNKVDVNKPVENPRLRELLNEFKQSKTNEVIGDLYKEIAMNAHFLSVIMLSEELEPDENGIGTFKKDTIMQFPMLTTQDGQSFFPVFTDWVELGKWHEMNSPKTLILSFDDYARMVLQDEKTQGIVINPFSDNMVLDRQLLEQLKTKKDIFTKGMSKQVITKDTQVLLGEPKNYPTEMVKAISKHLKLQDAVSRAWLRLMQNENEQSFLLVVDFFGDRETMFRGIADVSSPYLNGMYLDMVPYQDGFGKNAVENVLPFYHK